MWLQWKKELFLSNLCLRQRSKVGVYTCVTQKPGVSQVKGWYSRNPLQGFMMCVHRGTRSCGGYDGGLRTIQETIVSLFFFFKPTLFLLPTLNMASPLLLFESRSLQVEGRQFSVIFSVSLHRPSCSSPSFSSSVCQECWHSRPAQEADHTFLTAEVPGIKGGGDVWFTKNTHTPLTLP